MLKDIQYIPRIYIYMHKIKRRNLIKAREAALKEKKDKQITPPSFPKTKEDALKHEYKFWNTQPVPKLTEYIGKTDIIDKDICNNPNTEPQILPDGYDWTLFDMMNDDDLNKVANFINEYYVEDADGDFRLNYSTDFLRWYFTMPYDDKTDSTTCLGVVVKDSGLLVGFISSILSKNQIYNMQSKFAEINFLCVHPKLRNKRMTPLLIKEITRRLTQVGVSQAIYTANAYLPSPFGTATYHHRPIDITALVETGFTRLQKNVKLIDVKRAILLPKNPSDNFVKLEEHYVKDAMNVLNTYFDKYTCHPIFSENEFKHMFLNNNFVSSYVVVEGGNVVDFVSFYKLPYKVLKNNENHKYINAAYLYYYTSNVETIYTLINNMIIVAKNEGMQVFNSLDIMENKLILRDLKFEEGTGKINYYLYNYTCAEMKPFQIAKILF